MNVQLRVDFCNMVADGADGDCQLFGNFLVGLASAERLENFPLPLGEIREFAVVGQFAARLQLRGGSRFQGALSQAPSSHRQYMGYAALW